MNKRFERAVLPVSNKMPCGYTLNINCYANAS